MSAFKCLECEHESDKCYHQCEKCGSNYVKTNVQETKQYVACGQCKEVFSVTFGTHEITPSAEQKQREIRTDEDGMSYNDTLVVINNDKP